MKIANLIIYSNYVQENVLKHINYFKYRLLASFFGQPI